MQVRFQGVTFFKHDTEQREAANHSRGFVRGLVHAGRRCIRVNDPTHGWAVIDGVDEFRALVTTDLKPLVERTGTFKMPSPVNATTLQQAIADAAEVGTAAVYQYLNRAVETGKDASDNDVVTVDLTHDKTIDGSDGPNSHWNGDYQK